MSGSMNGSRLTDFFRPSAACLLSDKIERACENTKDIPSPSAVRRMLRGCYPAGKPNTDRIINQLKRRKCEHFDGPLHWKMTAEDRAKIVDMYQRGETIAAIAGAIGRHESTISSALKAAGIDRRDRVAGNKRNRVIAMLRHGGHSRSAIAEAVGCSHYYVRTLACKIGLKLGPSPIRKEAA